MSGEREVVVSEVVRATVEGLSVFELAGLAGVSLPDRSDSPGALFLVGVRDEVVDHWDGLSPDLLHQIAEDAAAVSTYEMWQQFVDLEGWQFDVTDLIGDRISGRELTEHVKVVLYAVADRLVDALMFV